MDTQASSSPCPGPGRLPGPHTRGGSPETSPCRLSGKRDRCCCPLSLAFTGTHQPHRPCVSTGARYLLRTFTCALTWGRLLAAAPPWLPGKLSSTYCTPWGCEQVSSQKMLMGNIYNRFASKSHLVERNENICSRDLVSSQNLRCDRVWKLGPCRQLGTEMRSN